LEELKEIADDANAYRFAEFNDELLGNLSESQREMGIRLVLLPATGDVENWQALKTLVLEGGQPTDLDGLKRRNVIESTSPPTYGHAKRREAALRWLTTSCREELREICERLIYMLGSHVQTVSPQVLPYAGRLVNLHSLAVNLGLSNLSQALCDSALSLLESRITASDKLLGNLVELKKVSAKAAPLLSMGLFNTLIAAKQEEALERRDALLDELRQLVQSYPQDAVVHTIVDAIDSV
jgi:hypothetical protein